MNLVRLEHDLIIDEGVKNEIYLDHLGYKTAGIGHLLTSEDPESGMEPGTFIPSERITEWFRMDLARAIAQVESLYGQEQFNSWPEEVQEILVNMCFNLGRAGLAKFRKFRAALEARDWKQAAIEGRDSLWYTQVTNRAERLMSRLENIS